MKESLVSIFNRNYIMNDELNIISNLASPSLPEVYAAADFANINR